MRLLKQPFLKRVVWCSAYGAGAAAIIIGISWFIGDPRRGLAFCRACSDGSVPLWRIAQAYSLMLPVAGATFGAVMPLYRYRFGGIVVGALVFAAAIVAGRVLPADLRRFGIQDAIVLSMLGILVIWGAHLSRAEVIGSDTDTAA